MAWTIPTATPPILGNVVGQHFEDIYRQITAGASGNTLVVPGRVLSVQFSGQSATDIGYSLSYSGGKTTITFNNFVNTKVYDVWIRRQ